MTTTSLSAHVDRGDRTRAYRPRDRRGIARVLTFGLFATLISLPASAQGSPGPIISGLVGAAALDSETNLAFAASAGFRFNSVFGMGIEVTAVPMIEADPPFMLSISSLSRSSIDISDHEGSIRIFTANVRLEIPTTTRRVVPYAVAGGGVASLKESFVVTYRILRPALTIPELVIPDVIGPILPPMPQPVSYASIAMALTLGGGISVLATDRFSIDADLRYLGLSGDSDRHLGRFGVGVSYRF